MAAFARAVVAAFCFVALCSASESDIEVHVYNAAGVPSKTLSSGRSTLTWIMQRAGVEVHWTDCPPIDPSLGPEQVCKEKALRRLFTITIVAGETSGPVKDTSLGYAMPTAGSRNHAAVFYSKVSAMA